MPQQHLHCALRITAICDYGGSFERSRACAALRTAGHIVTSHPESASGDMLVQLARSSEAVLLTQQRTHMTEEVIAELPRLKWVLHTGRTFSHLDADALTEHAVTVVGGGGSSPHSPAEMTWGLILASQRNLIAEANSV